MAKPIPLDEQIVAVLTADCTSAQAAAVLAEAKRVLADLTRQADAADVSSLDPLATSAKARELRQHASDQRFEADRMEASVSALNARVSDLKDAEASARRQAEHDEIRKRRDALAADIAKEYPALVRKLTELAKRIHESDAECNRVRLDSAEALARGVPANFYTNRGPVLRIIDRAPPTVDGIRLAWDCPGIDGFHYHGLAEQGA